MKKDGGPAFPRDSFRDEEAGLLITQNGMTLRDWFAGQALMGQIASEAPDFVDKDAEATAKRCYQIADAMLAEREKE